MSLGADIGTFNLVVAQRDENNNITYKKEVNAFLEMPLDNEFVFNMMKNAGVPLLRREDAKVAYALGEAAMNIAYTMPSIEVRRPMKDGCLNPKERNAQNIMFSMLNGMLNEAKSGDVLYYSVPANAINEETDADYHSKVLESIFKGIQGKDGKPMGLKAYPINEGLAVVYAEMAKKAYTAVGVSCGAGQINVCFAMFGAPIFQFSIVNAGDWIDKMAAKATGESPAFINKEKTKVNLEETSNSLIQRAIKAQYEIMIQKTIAGIKKGIEQSGNKARGEAAIDVVVSGGTSSPPGFEKLFGELLRQSQLPIELGEIIKPKDNLYTVAKGALICAEAALQG